MQNLVDACVGALVWFAWGHSFAHGEGGIGANEFIGGTVSDLRDTRLSVVFVAQRLCRSVLWLVVCTAQEGGFCGAMRLCCGLEGLLRKARSVARESALRCKRDRRTDRRCE